MYRKNIKNVVEDLSIWILNKEIPSALKISCALGQAYEVIDIVHNCLNKNNIYTEVPIRFDAY